MTAATGFYTPGESWLYRLDPRVRLWFSLLGIVLCILSTQISVLAGVLLSAHLILLLGRISPHRLGQLWKVLLPFLLIILIGQPLLMPGDGEALWQLGPVRITEAGLLRGVLYALRVGAAAFVALVPILTTPINTLVLALQKVGLPYTWGMMIGLALRYLETIQKLYTTISEAQQARGWDVSEGGIIRRARGAVPVLVAVIINSLRLGDSLALGLAARGFGLKQKRTTWKDITMQPLDWLAMGAATGLFAIGLWFLLQ